jgi:uncharacterized phage protein (TIGR02220 family)
MAERRMFAKTIIDSDAFLDMSPSGQSLYFHLAMRADDDGFINNPKKIQRMIGSNDDDLKILIAKKFIIPFDNGVVVIKHWKIHNYIQKDRYKETLYKEEKKMLKEKENKSYTLCVQDGYILDTQVRLGKVSIGKDSIKEHTVEKKENETTKKTTSTNVPFAEIVDYLNLVCSTSYKPNTEKTKAFINARFKEGFTLEDFKTVINKKSKEWLQTDMQKFLRPETLFGTKFESYLNQKDTPKGFAPPKDTSTYTGKIRNLNQFIE